MIRSPYQENIIWIIGASSGIGRALARELAARGATLALSARRQEELESLRDSLGNQHKCFPLDVRDAALMNSTALEIHAAFGRIDRVIFLAAAYKPMQLSALDMTATSEMVEVNILGAFYMVHAVLPILAAQASGQIALCGSVAGYTGLPGGQPYSATKAAIINLAESLKNETPAHIDIKLINPGFVKTPLTDKNDFPMPMIVSTEEAANAIANGLLSSAFEISFPRILTWSLKFLHLLPYSVALPLIQRLTLKRNPS